MRRRREVGARLAQMFDHTVRYGPFAGLRLGPAVAWGTDTGSMLLGLYEQEVLTELARTLPARRTFIDIGGANGYYAVGVLVAGLADRACCFERSEQARAVIAANAELNGVAARLRIFGTAAPGFHAEIAADHPPSQCVLFVDIEGAEFELLDDGLLEAFRGAVVFVELHEWFFPDGAERLRRLRTRVEERFTITELTTSSRDLSPFPELETFNDDDRWVICSEGRGRRMKWWRLDPRP
jgi:hypothetical protein